MKRLLSYLLAVCLLFSATAVSEAVGEPIIEPEPEITVDRMYKTLNLNGEESLTHGWIVVDVTITNYSLHTISVEDDLKADMLFDGLYTFTAEPVFVISEFEPLVHMSGSFVFKVPKLVLEAESHKMAASLKIDGKTMPIEMNFSDKTSAVTMAGSSDTPENLLVSFIDCLKNADFETLVSLFDYKEKSKYLDYELYLPPMKVIRTGSNITLADYEAYDVLNALDLIPTLQINTMVLSLLLGREQGNAIVLQYKNGTVTGRDYFTGEEMTVDEYVDRLNPKRLSDLSLENIGRMPMDPKSRTRALAMRNSIIYGYSDSREYILSVSFEGKTYYLGVTLFHFPEGWKIDSLSCQKFSQNAEIYEGEFAKEERTDDFDFDQLIYTWEKGEVISENLLKEPEITPDDLIGTWTCDEGILVFDEKYIKMLDHASGSESIMLYCVSENYLYLFSEEGQSEGEGGIALNGDWLITLGDEGEELGRLKREK